MTATTIQATNHDDQLGEIYPTMLNQLNQNCTFDVSFHVFIAVAIMIMVCGHHGLWPSWLWPSWLWPSWLWIMVVAVLLCICSYCTILALSENRCTTKDGNNILTLGGELLTACCRTDDLLPSIPISCLPPCCMDPNVLRLNILINSSQPGGSWTSNGSPPVCWWS